MNYFTTQVSNRLVHNDPSLTELSIRRFPLTSISSEEIASIIRSLQQNTTVKSVDISIPTIPHNWDDTDITAIEENENIPCNRCGNTYEYLFDTISTNSVVDSLTIRDIKSDDAWVALSNGMKLNTSIRDLTLGNTSNIWNLELSLVACQSLKEILLYGRNLQCLRLKSFSIPTFPCLEEICAGLDQCTQLRELVFHSIECNQLAMIISAITQSRSPLQKLTFIDCDFEFEHNENPDHKKIHPLMRMLSDASTLRELRINECKISCNIVHAICRGIEKNSTIELLDLAGCDLISGVGKSLSDMLRVNKSLLHLYLEENILGDQGISFLAAGIEANTSLQSLDLKANHFTENGCEHIVKSLKASCCPLRSLTISNNPINDLGAEFLGEALGENNSLECVDLHDCLIGDIGFEHICQGLASNASLKDINLSNNCCKRGHHISDMLSRNTVLESIDMSSCHISDETLGQLLRSLSQGTNTSLKSLYISFNAFANRGANAIAHMLLGGNKLEVVSAQYNAFDSAGLRSIASALSSSFYLTSFYFWNGQLSAKHDANIIHTIDHYLNLNRAGRRAILEQRIGTAIWADIIKRSDSMYGPSSVFNLLCEIPAMMKR